MDPSPPTCAKCKSAPSTLVSRGHPSCQPCFIKHITSKPIKSLSLLSRSLPPTPSSSPRHYILALSLGPSSLSLLHFLHQNLHFQLARNRAPPFCLTAVHITTTPTSLTAYQTRFPEFSFLSLPLSRVLTLSSVAWQKVPYGSGLPLPQGTPDSEADAKLGQLFEGLPSAASRADVYNLLVRHLLVEHSAAHNADALLLGHSTTALAELTITETVKGRGFGVPWTIKDGPTSEGVVVWRPARECLRKELVTYVGLVEGLAGLVREVERDMGKVVSHRDLSIEEVMARYFREVEESYPSVVANVARTTGKLVGVLGEGGWCGVCRGPLDEKGDERWRGELGVEGGLEGVCYGCERSTRG